MSYMRAMLVSRIREKELTQYEDIVKEILRILRTPTDNMN